MIPAFVEVTLDVDLELPYHVQLYCSAFRMSSRCAHNVPINTGLAAAARPLWLMLYSSSFSATRKKIESSETSKNVESKKLLVCNPSHAAFIARLMSSVLCVCSVCKTAISNH